MALKPSTLGVALKPGTVGVALKPTPARADIAAAAFAALIGGAAILAPKGLLRAFGGPSHLAGVSDRADVSDLDGLSNLNGVGVLGWRLMGIRTLGIAVLLLRRPDEVRRLALLTQLPDSVSFVLAWRSGALPAAGLARCLAGAGAMVTLTFLGGQRRKPHPPVRQERPRGRIGLDPSSPPAHAAAAPTRRHVGWRPRRHPGRHQGGTPAARRRLLAPEWFAGLPQ